MNELNKAVGEGGGLEGREEVDWRYGRKRIGGRGGSE